MKCITCSNAGNEAKIIIVHVTHDVDPHPTTYLPPSLVILPWSLVLVVVPRTRLGGVLIGLLNLNFGVVLEASEILSSVTSIQESISSRAFLLPLP